MDLGIRNRHEQHCPVCEQLLNDKGALMSARQRSVRDLVRQLRAVCLLSFCLPLSFRRDLDETIRRVPHVSAAELSRIETVARHTLDAMTIAGFRRSLDQYAEIAAEIGHSGFPMMWASKFHIDSEWFSDLGALRQDWHIYPPHTRFGVDAIGDVSTLEWRLLEATLFEDMAMSWNEATAAACDEDKGVKLGDAKIPSKKFAALKRSTIRAAFSFLEAYVNGIASDTLVTNPDTTKFSAGALELLRERGADGNVKMNAPSPKGEGFAFD